MDELYLGTTALKEAFSCLAQYDFHQNQKLVLRPQGVRFAVRRGIWVHSCVEAYHRGQDWVAALDALTDWATTNGVLEEDVKKAHEETARIVEDYLAFYKKEKPWHVVDTEKSYPLVFPQLSLTLAPTIDLLVWIDHPKDLWLVEIKTTREIPNATWRAVDPQTALQILAVEQNVGPVRGVIFDYILTIPPSVPRVTKGDSKNPPAFYANTAITSSRSFGEGVEELTQARSQWIKDQRTDETTALRSMNTYLAEARARLVNDARFFERHTSLRSPEQILGTMADIRVKIEEIRVAAAMQHWPRSIGLHCTKPQPCFYNEVCATEYIHGRRSESLRSELYMLDTGEREGRIEIGGDRGRPRLSITEADWDRAEVPDYA